MMDYETTAAHAIPSYLTRLYDVFVSEGLDPRRDTKLHTFVIGAEPHSEEHRRRIEEMFGVKAYNSFGLSEMNGPAWLLSAHIKMAFIFGKMPTLLKLSIQ
jgi:phenylacetate-CoA ligase